MRFLAIPNVRSFYRRPQNGLWIFIIVSPFSYIKTFNVHIANFFSYIFFQSFFFFWFWILYRYYGIVYFCKRLSSTDIHVGELRALKVFNDPRVTETLRANVHFLPLIVYLFCMNFIRLKRLNLTHVYRFGFGGRYMENSCLKIKHVMYYFDRFEPCKK